MKKTILFSLILVMLFTFAPECWLAAAAVPSKEQLNIGVVEKVFPACKSRDINSMDNPVEKKGEKSGRDPAKSSVLLHKEKLTTTMKNIITISNVIRLYIIDHNKAPEAKNFAKLNSLLSPFYIKKLPLKDAWGNDFHYYHGTGDKKYEYAIGSGAKDGVFNGWEQSGFYRVTKVSDFDNDILLVNGRFAYCPVTKTDKIAPPLPSLNFAGRLKTTMKAMYTIGLALKNYIEDYSKAPQVDSIKKLSILLQPFYIKTLPLADAWENEFLYKVAPGNPAKYWIGSRGSDGKFQGFDQTGTWEFKTGEKGQDIVLSNGNFTYKPDLKK